MRCSPARRFFAWSIPALALAGCAEGALIEHPACAWEAQRMPPPGQSVVDVASFSGDYDSNWGGCTFSQDGVRVFATCERGYKVMCRASGHSLDCGWISPNYGTHGKTRLTLERDGAHLNGPWGKDESVDDGGMWLFTRR